MPYITRTAKYGRGEPPVDFTPVVYEHVVVGEEMGPIIFDIKESTHQKHCDLFHHHDPWFQQAKVLFPWELWPTIRTITRWKYGRINLGIEAEYHYWFLKPVKVEQPLTGSAIIMDKYIKRDKAYVSFRGQTRDETGDLVFESQEEIIVLATHKDKVPYSTISRKRANEKGWWNEVKAGKIKRATKDVPEGLILPVDVRPPIPFRISGWDTGGWHKDKWKTNIHEDEFAHSKGYDGGLVEAPIVGEHGILELLVNFFGPEKFYTGGRWDMKLTGPTYMGDKLVGKARVAMKEPQNGGVRTTLDLRVEKEDGTLVQVGTASAVVE